MGKTLLLSFLGTTNYKYTKYASWADETAVYRTPFVAAAIAKLGDVDHSIILSTEQAKEKNWLKLLAEFDEADLNEPECRALSAGPEKQVLWEQFDVLKALLRTEDYETIILDITNGFRSLPMIAGGAATFVRMLEPRRDIMVLYGAWEAKRNNDVTPIWDISLFSDIIEWTRCVVLFLRTGSAEDLSAITKRLGDKLRKEWALSGKKGEEPQIDKFSKCLIAFSNDLVTLRTGDLVLGRKRKAGSAVRLYEAACNVKAQLSKHAPPLADVIDQVIEMIEPLLAGSLAGSEGIRAVAHLADVYYKMNRYAEVAATLREGWVNVFTGANAGLCTPASRGCDKDERERLSWRNSEYCKWFKGMREIRNDIEHAGYRGEPSHADTIIKSLEKSIEDFSENAPSYKPVAEDGMVSLFLNLSNHSSDKWGQRQTAAALKMADEIRDLRFPQIDPNVDEEEIKNIVHDVVKQVPANTTHAMVSGEYVATHVLVNELSRKGIVCLAATTERKTSVSCDGKKTSVFNFVKFRRFIV